MSTDALPEPRPQAPEKVPAGSHLPQLQLLRGFSCGTWLRGSDHGRDRSPFVAVARQGHPVVEKVQSRFCTSRIIQSERDARQ